MMSGRRPIAVIEPDWPFSLAVRGWVTTRVGGCSAGPYSDGSGHGGGLNLAAHVQDDPARVQRNRAWVQSLVPAPIRWLEQVHGAEVHDADCPWLLSEAPRADAAITTRTDAVLAVLTADCLPIFLTDEGACGVGLVHAGWRGLLAGVVEQTVRALQARLGADARLQAWLGPAIGAAVFEVGSEVRQAFCDSHPAAVTAFVAADRAHHWFCDLYALARQRLQGCGVNAIYGGRHCTLTEVERFYSYRRDGRTGRMAALLWLHAHESLR